MRSLEVASSRAGSLQLLLLSPFFYIYICNTAESRERSPLIFYNGLQQQLSVSRVPANFNERQRERSARMMIYGRARARMARLPCVTAYSLESAGFRVCYAAARRPGRESGNFRDFAPRCEYGIFSMACSAHSFARRIRSDAYIPVVDFNV